MKPIHSAIIGLLTSLITTAAMADANSELHQLQSRWAQVNYELKDKAQVNAFADLAKDADAVIKLYPDNASVWIWSGIIKSTYAGAKGGLGALGLAKESKHDLEKAMELDAGALDGSAYASLGTLYYSVPGWPVGFGDDDKAQELLLRSLEISPKSIDNNYFYASYLMKEKRYDEALSYLEAAQVAAPRPDRPLADSGRQREIKLAIAQAKQKL
jgi:tetratricopeptide (TPR) repeat protein